MTWVIVDCRGYFYSGNRATMRHLWEGDDEFVSVPTWSEDWRNAHVYSTRGGAEKALRRIGALFSAAIVS